MRKLIIAGSYAQYRDYLQRHNVNPLAAPCITSGSQLRAYDRDSDEIVLVGSYHDNEAYLSFDYLSFIGAQRPQAVAV